jgi:FkbM family methyltransferase
MTDPKSALKRFIHDRLPPQILMRRLVSYGLKHGEPELLLVGLLCDKSSAMIDVGANRGVYSYIAAKYAAQVHALEPVPEMAEWIRKIAPANVTVHEVAASDRDATQTLYIPMREGAKVETLATLRPDLNPGAEIKPIEITTKRLDGMDFSSVGLIKIDVEGHEQAVLAGASGLVGRERPSVLIECEERHAPNTVADTARFFATYGYRGFFWKAGALQPIERFDLKRDQELENLLHFADWHDRLYINNFLFVHPARTAVMARLPLASLQLA